MEKNRPRTILMFHRFDDTIIAFPFFGREQTTSIRDSLYTISAPDMTLWGSGKVKNPAVALSHHLMVGDMQSGICTSRLLVLAFTIRQNPGFTLSLTAKSRGLTSWISYRAFRIPYVNDSASCEHKELADEWHV